MRRTLLWQKIPWDGGLNSSVDSGAIPDNDLTIADDIVFSTSGNRIKRQGWEYYDALSAPPTPTHRSSSGTTRKLIFAAAVKGGSPTNDKFVVGERFTSVSTGSGNDASYAGTFVISAISTTNVTDDTIEFTGSGSLAESTTATTTITITRARPIIAIHDYWRFVSSTATKSQRIIAITGEHATSLPALPLLFYYDSDGRRVNIATSVAAASNFPTTITKATTTVMNEKLIVAFDGKDNKPIKYNPDDDAEWELLGGTPPSFSIMQVHQGRLWTNDKSNPDRLHFSSISNPEEWQGNGDSGAIDIISGDGDSQGITAIFPSFKGSMFVAKGNKLYEIIGDSPENYGIRPLTVGLGVANHKAVAAVDVDDVVFASFKGFHSLVTTDQYGDFTQAFLSSKIQPTFNEFQSNRLSFIEAAYVPSLNSVAFAVSEEGESDNSALYLYNTVKKEWYRWPDADAQALGVIEIANSRKLFFGTSNGRLVETQNGEFSDFTSQAISYRIKTGSIYPDGNPLTVKAFKRLTLWFKPRGNYTFTATVKIDNFPTQSISFSETIEGDLLDDTFVLGQSSLGSELVMAPYSQPIDGYGHGCTIEIQQNTVDQQVEIYGLMIEYESADIQQEVIGAG